MADPVKQFIAVRQDRDEAKRALEKRVAQVRADIAARSPVTRLKDMAREEAVQALDAAIDVAAESKGVIAGTILALALWFCRNPITDWVEMQLKRDQEQE